MLSLSAKYTHSNDHFLPGGVKNYTQTMQRMAWTQLERSHMHLARLPADRQLGEAFHCHDFAEVFWLESGGLVHEVNGVRERLAVPCAVWIRPDDAHRLRPVPGGGLFVNLALPWAAARSLGERYPVLRDAWQHQGSQPRRTRLDQAVVRGLGELLPAAVLPDADAALRDLLLLHLVRATPNPAAHAAANPAWLEDALQAVDRDPEAIRRGVHALVAASGRSLDHVNRCLRRATGRTSSQWICDRRLDLAARGLALGDESISGLALECGFENLGYFYRCFKSRFGCTPRRYRLRARQTVGRA